MQRKSNLDIAQTTYAHPQVYGNILGALVSFIGSGNLDEFQKFERFLSYNLKQRDSMSDLGRANTLVKLLKKGFPWEVASGQYLDFLKKLSVYANSSLKDILPNDQIIDYRLSEKQKIIELQRTQEICYHELIMFLSGTSESFSRIQENASQDGKNAQKPNTTDFFMNENLRVYESISSFSA